jgi:hypothetical protein
MKLKVMFYGNRKQGMKDSIHLTKLYSNGADFILDHKENTFPAHMMAVTLGTDSTLINWEVTLNAGNNPLKKLRAFIKSVQIRNQMKKASSDIASFLNHNGNIYDFSIDRTNFNNSILLAIRENDKNYTSTDRLYALIDSLRTYVQNNGATETDSPMYHAIEKDNNYDVMVALPINKVIVEKPPFFIIRMIHGEGKFVMTKVKGGPILINKAHRQIQGFMIEHGLTSPAIPFEILITDRRKVSDTAQWVTKIYYPST